MPRYDIVCPNNHEEFNVVHTTKESHPVCRECGQPTETLWRTYVGGITPDDIPGGILIKNGICWPNGEPKRYYSKSDIKKAAFEAGWTQGYDTPKVNQRLEEKKAKEREERNKR